MISSSTEQYIEHLDDCISSFEKKVGESKATVEFS